MADNVFATLDDSRKPLFGPNYGLHKNIAMILPKNKIAREADILIHQIIIGFVILEFIEVFIIRYNLGLMLTTLKIYITSIFFILKTNTYTFWHEWMTVIDYVKEVYKYEIGNRDSAWSNILRHTKDCRQATFFYWIHALMSFVIVSFTPHLRAVTLSNFIEELRNDTEVFPGISNSLDLADKLNLLRERCKQMLGSVVTCDEEARNIVREMHQTFVLLMK